MMSANISNTQRKAIYRRDGYRCALCDYTTHLQLHHVIPRGKGGPDSPQNLITLCSDCHALCHGTDLRGLGKEVPTVEEMEQACIEYLADLYAAEGEIWNPWGRDQMVDGLAPTRDKDPVEEDARETMRILEAVDPDNVDNAMMVTEMGLTASDQVMERVLHYLDCPGSAPWYDRPMQGTAWYDKPAQGEEESEPP